MSRALRGVVLLALLGAILALPALAGATRRPSAHELWRQYPLHATPGPTLTASPRVATRRVAEVRHGGGSSPLLIVGIGALIGAGSALVYLRLRRRAPAPAPGATPRPPASPPRTPARTVVPRADTAPVPPRPDRPWSAELAWRETDAGARFAVVASMNGPESAITLAQTGPLDWPPSGPDDVQALSDAAVALERSLLRAGWAPAEPGDAWYAKRFAWPASRPATPARVPAPAAPPAPAPHPAAAPQPARAPQPRDTPWPAETADRWRCEITWKPGYVNSRFRAVAYGPHRRRGRTLAASAAFRWLFMDDPDPQEQGEAARRLVATLESAGWERVQGRPEWYGERFVWPHDDPPPTTRPENR
jgi:hypothetical protein